MLEEGLYMKKALLISLLFFISSVNAEEKNNDKCFVFYDIKGLSIYGNENNFSKDAFKNKSFIFNVKDGTVFPDKKTNGLLYKFIPPSTFISISSNKGDNYIETWSAEIKNNIMYYSRIRTGGGIYNVASLFIGKVSKC